MDKQQQMAIAAAVLVVVILLVLWFTGRDKNEEKDSYHMGQGYGWKTTDWLFGAGRKFRPPGCGTAAHKHHACEIECEEYPQGMSHSRCLEACHSGEKRRAARRVGRRWEHRGFVY